MSGVILPIRCVVASLMSIFGVGVPRALHYFGLRAEALDALISPWATFIIFGVAIGLVFLPFLKTIKFIIPGILVVIGVAVVLTFVACQLPLPW